MRAPHAWRTAASFLLVSALALCAMAHATAQQQPEIRIETSGKGEAITVTASVDMQVDPLAVWNAITDYDHLADFIPDMHSSRVVQRDGDKVLVEQSGKFGLLVFSQAVDVKLEVIEQPYRRVTARAIGGNLKEMEGRYAVDELASGATRLSYSGRLVPDFPVPLVIGRLVVRQQLARQFTALVQEIVRRDAMARGAPAAQ